MLRDFCNAIRLEKACRKNTHSDETKCRFGLQGNVCLVASLTVVRLLTAKPGIIVPAGMRWRKSFGIQQQLWIVVYLLSLGISSGRCCISAIPPRDVWTTFSAQAQIIALLEINTKVPEWIRSDDLFATVHGNRNTARIAPHKDRRSR